MAVRGKRHRSDSRPSLVCQALAVVSTVALFGAVAIAASRTAPHRVDQNGDGVLLVNITVAFAVVVVAISLLLVALALTFRGSGPKSDGPVRHIGFRVLFGFMVAMALLTFVMRRVRRPTEGSSAAGGDPPVRAPVAPPASGHRPVWGLWLGGGMVIAVLLLVAVSAVVLRRRRAPRPDGRVDLHADAASEVGDVVRAVEDEPDPRRAVIRAYDGMERVLAAFGVTRVPSETPRELLQRAVAAAGLSDTATADLTDLYVAAHFAPHEVDAAMRMHAIDALRRVRAELQVLSERDQCVAIGSDR